MDRPPLLLARLILCDKPELVKNLPFVFLCGLLWMGRAPAQNHPIDSLRDILSHTSDRAGRIEVLFALGKNFYQADSLRRYGEQIITLVQKGDHPRGIGMGERLLGDADNYQAKYIEAVAHYDRSAAAFGQTGQVKEQIIALHNAAFALLLLGHYGDAYEHNFQAYHLVEHSEDRDLVGGAAHALGTSLLKMGRYREAIPYFHYALIWHKTNSPGDLICGELAEAYSALGVRDSAAWYLQKALNLALSSDKPNRIASAQHVLGGQYVESGSLDSAEFHLKSALTYYDTHPNSNIAPNLYYWLSELELKRKNPQATIVWAEKGLAACRNLPTHSTRPRLHQNLYRAYVALGQPQQALDHALAWKTAADSVAVQDNARKIAEVESRYRSREQQTIITQQQLQLERQQNRQQIILLIGLLLLALAGGLAVYLRLKKQRAELALRLKDSETQHLREQDRMKSAFFANISHEFRTPLTLILGPLREMEAGIFKGNVSKYFGIMRRNAERLLQLINQLLDLSRLESGKLLLQLQPGNLAVSLRAMAHAFESLAAQRQVEYAIQLPAQALPVWFDRDKMEIIVSNLLSNAFKFTPEEGKVSISVRNTVGRDEKTVVEIQVADSGIGIPAEQQARIFDRFYQVENNSTDETLLSSGGGVGSGIGLALTREIVLLYGGTIGVADQPGGGTVFIITLPLRTATLSTDVLEQQKQEATFWVEPVAAAALPIAEGVEKVRARHQPVVLIVEDNADVRAYIVEQLHDQYQLLEAADGQTALEIARTELPDLLISDLMMPIMDGVALTQQLKSDERTSHIPVILLTAKAGQPDRLQGLETGAEAYLTKPFDAAELRLVVRKIIAQRQVLREKFSREIRLGLPKMAAPSLDDLFLQRVLAAIEENLDDELFGVEELAAAVNMSRSNLFRKLDALTGKSATHLIRELRLVRAKQLLEQGAGNTTEVAFMVGFNTPAYFVKCFTDQYGVTPGDVRKGKGVEKFS